jgi:hypothetical protein
LETAASSSQPSVSPPDPLALPLLASRILCAFAALMPLPLGLVAWLSTAATPAPTSDVSALVPLGVAGLGACVLGAGVYLWVLRSQSLPWLYAAGSYLAVTLGGVAALMGFVASLSSASLLPFLVSLVPAYAMAASCWPRRGTWERATARHADRAVGDRTSAST